MVFGLIGSKLGMPPQGGLFCNKCKSGVPAEGDSWCKGCSGLDVSQELLKLRWRQPGLRKVAEETVLNTARLLRAFSNLDQNLGSSSAGDTPRADRREAGRKSVPPPRGEGREAGNVGTGDRLSGDLEDTKNFIPKSEHNLPRVEKRRTSIRRRAKKRKST